MAFKLNEVVPWGRNIDEYREMFLLSGEDMKKKLAGFGDGPSSFNYQATAAGTSITSFDPIYLFSTQELKARIDGVKDEVMQQMSENMENYLWNKIKSLEELERIRMSAMRLFLEDYERGKAENRYIYYELPNRLPYGDGYFDIGLSSHFLLMYTFLGYDFHVSAITEMLRVCKEVRIFPLGDLDGNNSELTDRIISFFEQSCNVRIKTTPYEFQKGANCLLVLNKRL